MAAIVSTNHLHHHRWEAARHSTAEQLETSAATQDPIVLAESILMAAVLREHDGRDDLARRAAVVAGPAFAEWAEPVWLAFTVHPSENLYRSATVRGQGRPATIDRLVTWAARVA